MRYERALDPKPMGRPVMFVSSNGGCPLAMVIPLRRDPESWKVLRVFDI
jgi:hypothetical protein